MRICRFRGLLLERDAYGFRGKSIDTPAWWKRTRITMRKIASPRDLQHELTGLLKYAEGPNPSRAQLASNLRRLATGVYTKKTAASGLWSDLLLDWMSEVLKDIFEAATSSFKVTSDRGQRNQGGVGWAHRFSVETDQGTADVDISVSWDRGQIIAHGAYHVGTEVELIFGTMGASIAFGASAAKVVATAKSFFSKL